MATKKLKTQLLEASAESATVAASDPNQLPVLNLPNPSYHKSQNGKLLIIGGSSLFHAASIWSAQLAAHLVDMVFYSSVADNNQLVQYRKTNFADGIVVPRQDILSYAQEADVILIGPGMMRGKSRRKTLEKIIKGKREILPKEWEDDTYLIVNLLLARLNDHKFVIDAGALQMVEPEYLTDKCILTPHQKELTDLQTRATTTAGQTCLFRTTVLSKNLVDEVWQQNQLIYRIEGGNAGLTKGGSGDALAGLVAGLYCYNHAAAACAWASKTIKATAETLAQDYGPFYSTTNLVETAPRQLWKLIQAYD